MASSVAELGRRMARPWSRVCLMLAALAAAPQVAGQDAPPPPTTAESTASQPAPSAEDAVLEELDDATDLLEMKVPVVVSATRSAQPISALPYAISVITAEDIRRSGARTIGDALRLAPGVDVADLTANNFAASPRGFHGFTSRGVQVLVDGRQLFDSLFGGCIWGAWPFQLEDIERIEVVRGPGGATWGANALNGVINIVTKDPKDQLGVTMTGGGGSRGANKEHLGYAFADDKLRLRISGEHEGSDGFTRGGSWLRSLDDGYGVGRMGLHAIYEPRPADTYTFSAGSSILKDGYPPTPMVLSAERQAGAQANYALGRWTHRVDAGNSYEITAYLNDFWSSAGAQAIDYRYQQYALQYGHTLKVNEQHTLTWGVDTRLDYFDATGADPFMLTRGVVTSGIAGLYLKDQWRLAPRWTLHAGGRVDYDSYGGFQPSGRVALSYELSEHQLLYGAVSRAFQMAPGAMRFLDLPLANGLARVTVDRDVGPMTLLAYELGYRGRHFDRLDLSGNFFWHTCSAVTTLTPYLGPPGLMHMNLENHGTDTLFGVEAEARYRVTDTLTLLGNYTYQEHGWRSAVPYHYTDMPTSPAHKFMVGARYDPLANLHLSSHLYFVDAVRAPDPAFPFVARDIGEYFRLDLQAEYEFWDKRASLAVGVRNLLDGHHPESATLFLNSAEVPRMIYAELRIRFP
ncbi:MAG: TonB-dependent receptor [Planctomycetes bacterium]|nr:TonB-dependent receptor [Planctomycetota bacterium]